MLYIPHSLCGCDALVPHHFSMVHLHKFNNFNIFSDVRFKNWWCNFTVVSCFDLLEIVMRVIFQFVPLTMLMRMFRFCYD